MMELIRHRRFPIYVLGIGLLIALIFPWIVQDRFAQNTAIFVLMYGLMAQAWNIMGGYTGLISVGQVAYFGIGAYTSAFLYTHFGINPWIALLIGGLITAMFGVVAGYPVSKLRGRYFSIATIAMAEVMRISFSNWEYVGAARGIQLPIEKESLLTFQFHSSRLPYYYIILFLFIVVNLVVYFLERSRTGYYFRAIRDNEEAAAGLGINRSFYKLLSIGISAFFTALAGSFLTQFSLYVEPDYVFASSISITVAMVAVLGGIGSLGGPILGALVLIPLSEYTRAWLGKQGQGLDLMLYGALIIIFCILEPKGLMGLWKRISAKKRTNP